VLSGKERPTTAVQVIPEPAVTFSGFRLEPDGTLYRGRDVIHLPVRELAALRLLLAHAGQVVTPAQLKDELWGDVHVTADSVPKCLSSLRARLVPEECIQTVYKRGYRLSADVRRIAAGSSETLPRLAVMPFETGFGFPEHLGLGVVEEMIDRLVNMRPAVVSVLARDSVFTLARDRHTPQQVGRELNADLVLAGTLRALPEHFRLRAEMIRVEDGTAMWVEDVLVGRSQIGTLESELIGRLVFRLGAEPDLLAGMARGGGSAPMDPQMGEARENYLRARYECRTLERHRMQDGFQHLLRAAEMDPSLTSAQVDLAFFSCEQALYGFMRPALAAENVRRAQGNVPGGSLESEVILSAAGWVSFHFDRDLTAAVNAFRCSAHLPYDARDVRLRAMFALSRCRFDEAIALIEVALREDPYSPLLHARMAWALHLAGHAEESVDQIRRAASLFPGYEWTALYGAMILAYNGEAAAGIELAAGLAQQHPYFDLGIAVHSYALACAGRADEARLMLDRLQWMSRERFVLRSFMPAAYAVLGDHETALAELQAADESRCPWFFQMLADPRLKPLAGKPIFERLRCELSRMESAAAA
jgi:DNA-binding winged helix-turn-helix (wHTH) protein/tetratricopeptide (TPR) repeat protein